MNRLGARQSSIQTERLVLKAYEEQDCKDMIALLQNEEIKKTFMIPDFSSEEEVTNFFHKLVVYSQSEEHFEYGIYLEQKLIGFVNDVEMNPESIELGYVISPDMKNHGYATEVLAAAINELFRMGYQTVRTGLFEENIASRRVMEKCGMTLTNQTEDIEYQGKMHHCIYFEIHNA